MLSSKPNNDKVLKIFSSIRCLNRDQLPRYIDGRLTDVEKHLVEQHLTDCDLCFGALQALEKGESTEQYQELTNKLQRHVHNTIQPVSHVQKVAQYTRKERNKEHMLVFFWLLAFIGLGIGSVYVLRGHMRYQPPPPIHVVAASLPEKDTASANANATTTPPIVNANNAPATTTAIATTVVPQQQPTNTPPVTIIVPPSTPAHPDSAALKKAAALKALQKKATADSLRRVKWHQHQEDSLRRAAAEKAKEKEDDDDHKIVPPPALPKEKDKETPTPEPKLEPRKEAPTPTPANSEENLYKTALTYQQQGNLAEAIDRLKRIEAFSSGRYVEQARYQLAICYRMKGQTGKARRMFKEVVKMDGSLKTSAQEALNSM
ncbi:tetratricopeptide repeat protein [Chitinophaga sp. 30R24]|uniref:tetratricopeptide repeat protein n=1 Tax=Chitinophaga sp. 30R24 TaxID=3248838 RepID=UPI003B905F4A